MAFLYRQTGKLERQLGGVFFVSLFYFLIFFPSSLQGPQKDRIVLVLTRNKRGVTTSKNIWVSDSWLGGFGSRN